jgi:ABC-type glycerol-3-phosphate transport system substrate-binding protein
MKTQLMLFCFSILLAWGCKDEVSDAGTGKMISTSIDPTPINFIGHWKNEGLREKIVVDLSRAFEFRNQEYSMNLKFPDEVYWDRSNSNCESEFIRECVTSEKSNWDIIRINNLNDNISQYLKDPNWAVRYLVDFSTMPEFTKNVKPELLDSIKKSWGGILPGPIIEGFNWAIWFNKELASELGLTIKQFGMTADDFFHYVQVVSEYNKKTTEKIIPIFECGDWSTISTLAFQMYLSELDKPSDIFKDNVEDQKLLAWKKTLKFFEALASLKIYDYNWKDLQWEKTQDYPLKKKCLFYVNATWMYNIWQKMDNVEVVNMIPAELPTFKNTTIYFGGYNIIWAVPKNAPNKEAAIKFLVYMNSPDVAEKWSRFTKCSTGIKGNLTATKFGFDQFEDFNFYIDQKYGNSKIQNGDASLIVGKSKRGINNYLLEVAYGQLSADEAMRRLIKSIN